MRLPVLCLAVVALLLGGCAKPELIVLLEGEDGAVGEIEVEKNGQAIVLDEALSAARVDGAGSLAKTDVDQGELEASFAAALAATPKQPAFFVLYFHEGRVDLVSESMPELRNMFAELSDRQAPNIQVTGHTDRVGTVTDNDKLALDRAQEVREMLIGRGIDAGIIIAVGRGEREPLVPTEDEVREPRNRRVEVTVR